MKTNVAVQKKVARSWPYLNLNATRAWFRVRVRVRVRFRVLSSYP